MQLTRRLDVNHDMTFGRGLANFARDAEATAQNVRTRLLLLQGEWFLDVDAGVPYLQRIAVKPADFPFVESVIKQTILDTDGVASMESFEMEYDGTTRELIITTSLTDIYGNTINIQVRK
jgi:hypothetical protein